MGADARRRGPHLAVLAAVALAYFLCYPEDLAAVHQVLALSQALPLGLYLLLAALLLCWTATRLWGPTADKSVGMQ